MESENPIQFFTATILEWKHLLKPDKYKQIIIDSLQFLADDNRAVIYGFIVMPNHVHIIWQIVAPHKRANVQRDFLKFTAHKIINDLQKHHPEVLKRFRVDASDRKYQIWERNPLSVDITSRKMLEQKLEYIHHNPVQERWQLADNPVRYLYSSMSYYETGLTSFEFIKHYIEAL